MRKLKVQILVAVKSGSGSSIKLNASLRGKMLLCFKANMMDRSKIFI